MEYFKSKYFMIGGVSILITTIIFIINYNLNDEKYYNITFDSNGGSKIINQTVFDGNQITEPINPEQEGYIFQGWYVGNKKYDFSKDVHQDINLKAKWKKDGTDIEDVKEENTEDNKEEEKKEEVPNNNVNNNQNNSTTNNNQNNNQTNSEPKPTEIKATSISLNNNNLSLEVGQNSTLVATINPSNATNKSVTWTSSNNSVATVADGKITALAAGTTTITATADGKSASCTVTVTKIVTYSHEIVDIPSSAIGQCYIYIKSSEGNRVGGTINITYTNGKSETVDVPVDGIMKVKNTISSVSIVSAG